MASGMPNWIDASMGGAIAGTTVRAGGCSTGPWLGLNLGPNSGDDPECVRENRMQFSAHLPASVAWLTQVHGTTVIERASDNVADEYEADAHWTRDPDIALTIQTADCLPVVFLGPGCIAAAHAGWRGLAAGVLEATVHALPAEADRLQAWIGPAISQPRYEVGDEVRAEFLRTWPERQVAQHFAPGEAGKWWPDLAGLAAAQLEQLGVVTRCSEYCTHTDQRFYSYRRDGQTGRQATFIRLAS